MHTHISCEGTQGKFWADLTGLLTGVTGLYFNKTLVFSPHSEHSYVDDSISIYDLQILFFLEPPSIDYLQNHFVRR